MLKLLHNAHIHTLDDRRPQASALLIGGGRVLAVGGEDLLNQVDERVPREDLAGRTVWPGLTDAHLHLRHFALNRQKVDCTDLSLSACLERVRERAARTRRGAWILGHGWDQNLWGSWGNRHHLDAAAPDHPVYLTARSLHAGWANSAALQQAGISSQTQDPPDGRLLRDAAGQPTGVLLEGALRLLETALPSPSLPEVTEAIAAAQPVLWSYGLTGVHDFDGRLSFQALQRLRRENRLRLRVLKGLPYDLLPEALGLGLQSGCGDEWLRIGALKVFMDGALGPRTAAMLAPYEDEPHNRGDLLLDGDELYAIARQAAAGGLHMAVHAIGDRANREALSAFARLRAEGDTGRHRIEHVQLLHPDDRQRLAALGLIASMQPTHLLSDMDMAAAAWGQRARWAYAWRTQWQAGAVLAFGSDAPVETPNPFLGLYAAVTRRRQEGFPGAGGWYPAEALDLATALRGFTHGAAWAAGQETFLGRLAPNFAADLIVLPVDPFTIPPEDLPNLRPLRTMVGGEWVWPKSARSE